MHWHPPDLGDIFGVFWWFEIVDDAGGRGLKSVVVPGDIQAPARGLVFEAVAAVAWCPESDFFGKNRLVVECSDYTRVVTCLIEIGLN